MTDIPDPGAFGATFEEFMRTMLSVAERRRSAVTDRLRDHVGTDPNELPTTSVEFAVTDQANLQLALDAVIPDAELVGFTTRHVGFGSIGLTEILAGETMAGPVSPGPIRYLDVEVGDGRMVQCIDSALLLVWRDVTPIALVLSRGGDHPMQQPTLKLEGVSPKPGAVSELVRELRAAMRAHNVFRGQIISLHQGGDGGPVTVQFHRVPVVPRDGVILPEGTLERLERHTIGITQSAGRLRAAGKHLKRGVLLHGPPGTGKTLSTMYLLGAMTGRTTILLTGRGLGLIEQAMEIGRELAPATFVFEDIDLVAAERTMEFASQGVLFELLNQMEGLAEDEDLLFLLTTNRPDVIEPALAARPGRVDLALEIPLPSPEQRRQLFLLYGQDIGLDQASLDQLVDRSDRTSGAFIKELVRQAWLRAALADREAPTGDDLRRVLDDLLEERSTMTRRLLGQPGDDGPGGQPLPEMDRALAAAGLPIPPFLNDPNPE
jgi:hypothetical protein